MRLTTDHKPNLKNEKKRITDNYGVVHNIAGVWRASLEPSRQPAGAPVFHMSVSRGFGDVSLKEPYEIIVPTPEVDIVPLTPEDWFFVIGCDGIWDVLSDQQVVDTVGEHIDHPESAAQAVADLAFNKMSMDNLTVIVVFFDWTRDAATAFFEQRKASSTRKLSAQATINDDDDDYDMFASH